MKFLRLLGPANLQGEDYVFTLDHDGGLVVSLEVLQESGALNSQLQGVKLLKELQRKRRNEQAEVPALPNPV